MNRIKVLHISPSGTLYGTERHILSIVKYADKEIFEHSVATPSNGNLNEILENIKVTYFIAGRKPGYSNSLKSIFEIKDFWLLHKLIKHGNFDIVHSHLNFYSCIVAKLAGAKKVVHTRHGIFWSEEDLRTIGFFEKYFQEKKSRIVDLTIALSEIEKKTLIEHFNYPESKIRKVYNGVSVEDICEKLNAKFNKDVLFKTNKFIVGTVGRFERQKGFDILLKIARNVVDQDKDILFVIIGSGSQKNMYKNMIEDLKLNGNVLLLGYKNNIYDFINNFDVFVQTSRWEGVPYVVLEAMALKKPIVAISHPNVTGISEIVVNGESGLLATDNFKNTMTEYIMNLKEDTALKTRLGEASLKRVSDFYTEEKMSKDMHNIYLNLI